MAKSKGSCFRIMNCACGDSASTDKLALLERKVSSEKPWWSFRKSLSGPRVLSKNAILEPESVDYNTGSMDAIPSSCNSAMNLCVSDKASIQKNPSMEDLLIGPALSTAVNSKVSAIVVAQNGTSNDENIQESAVIIIQAAIRGHLGVRKFREVKYVIKLQAAVRGHLVRAHVVGTLRCIRAIIKMQAIVRARLGSQGKVNCCEGTESFYSTKRLLSSRFAQQMLASTPKTRPIYIKCDYSKSDAVWKWLERWTATICSHSEGEIDKNLNHANKEYGVCSKLGCNHEKKNRWVNSKSIIGESALPSKSKGDLNATSESNLRILSADCFSDSCVSSVEKDEKSDIEIKEVSKQPDVFSGHILLAQSALTPLQTNDHISDKNEYKGNTLNNPSKLEHYGLAEIEAQKLTICSRRPCNPVFVAAQSKYEELTSDPKNVKCIGSFSSNYQGCSIDAKIGNYQSQVKKYKETDFSENLPSCDSIIKVAASECGTEISISSTLDSPDRSETECGEIILEIGSIDANNCSDKLFIYANKVAESWASESNKLEDVIYASPLSSGALDMAPPVQQQESIASDVQGHLGITNSKQDTASVEGTPRSYTATLELYGTPSSEISVNVGSRNKDDNKPSQKQMPTGSGRKLTSRVNSDSFARPSTDHLSNDPKNDKKKQYIGVSGTGLGDEPLMSNSNNSSLPSYMQATKSARAKAHANNSPKSSPDLLDKANYIKKRHSLPFVGGKLDSSPPKLRSTPRAQQNSKSNGVHAPHTSTDRRWQR